MKERLDRLELDIRDALEDDLLPADTYQEVVDLLDEAEELRQELRQPDAYRRFLQNYLEAELDALRRGDREEPLCRCNYDYCDVSEGRLPGKVRGAESLTKGIGRFRESHPEAVVLSEARTEWLDRRSTYRSLLRKARAKVKEGLERTAMEA